MKRLTALILTVCALLLLVGCNRTLDDIIEDEPSITGIVKEVYESSCLIESNGSEYTVSLNVKNSDSYTSIKVGDEIVVYYDGNIAESYPMQINKVYAITLKSPAD